MAKKRIFGLALSLFVALGVAFFSQTSKNNDFEIAHAEGLVGNPKISWNNIDYSRGVQNFVDEVEPIKDAEGKPTNAGVPTKGYCLLVQYSANIATTIHDSQNLIGSGLAGCNVEDYIKINGQACKNVSNTLVYGYPLDSLFIYVPYSSVAFSDTYEYVTVEILEGLSIDGSASVVGSRFEYRGLLGSHSRWLLNPSPAQITKVEFDSLPLYWNNVDLSYAIDVDGWWSGELAVSGSPKNGYCFLAFFKEDGKTVEQSRVGDVYHIGRGIIGKGSNIDHKVKINGVDVIDVEGSIIHVYPQYGLFIYVPDASLSNRDIYQVPTVEFLEGIRLIDVELPAITFEFRGELGQPYCWNYVREESEYNHFPFETIAPGYNNRAFDATHTDTVLRFGEFTDYLKDGGEGDSTNLVNKYSDCGTKITVNGIPLWQFEDAVVSYLHGFCYVYIVLPISALFPSNNYRIVTLHIEDKTIFYDTMLSEVTLYLYNGEWTTDRPISPSDDDYDGAFTFSGMFGQAGPVVIDENHPQLAASKEVNPESFGLYMDYKLEDKDSEVSISTFVNHGLSPLRMVFKANEILLYNDTQDSTLLGSVTLSNFIYDDWYSLFIYTKVENNGFTLCASIDNITYIQVSNFNAGYAGNGFLIEHVNGSASYKDTVFNSDNKKPVLSYSGKAVYGVEVGSDKIDFSNKCTSLDVIDGDITKKIEYIWPQGSLTSDDKINEGSWEVLIRSADKSNNTAKVRVLVIATNKLNVVVTFDGENPTTYKIGDHIAPIADPVKQGEGSATYKFLGWYYNDVLWDFENDYIVSDMNLVSKFQESSEEHLVVFRVSGLKGIDVFTLYFTHGTRVNIDIFARADYTLKAYIGEDEVDSFTVNRNMEVQLVYTSTKPDKPSSSGCGGNIVTSTILLSTLSGAALVLLVVLKKKGGKKHE